MPRPPLILKLALPLVLTLAVPAFNDGFSRRRHRAHSTQSDQTFRAETCYACSTPSSVAWRTRLVERSLDFHNSQNGQRHSGRSRKRAHNRGRSRSGLVTQLHQPQPYSFAAWLSKIYRHSASRKHRSMSKAYNAIIDTTPNTIRYSIVVYLSLRSAKVAISCSLAACDFKQPGQG